MSQKILNMLSSNAPAKEVCVMGNEAIARGAIEAGVQGVFAYPGNPSTEISEVFRAIFNYQNNGTADPVRYPIYFEYSVNEKIALEKAIAYTIGKKSAMCCMKNVGLNVASDALMTITYQTIDAPLVIVVCDDPGCHSSSNEQDSRYWGKMASVPVLSPATPDDAKNMCKEAFALSEKLRLPVIVRMTTRVDHSRGMVSYGDITSDNTPGSFSLSSDHINIPARTATAHQKLLEKLNDDSILSFGKANNSSSLPKNCSLAIIASGVSASLAAELLEKYDLEEEIGILKLGIVHPFPSDDVLAFLKNGPKKFLILEELDPIIEDGVRSVAQSNKIDCEILGKGLAGLTATGEYSLDLIRQALETFSRRSLKSKDALPSTELEPFLQDVPPRPPVLCAACPHRATFYVLKLLKPRESNMVLCGDIGCFGLGALPPLKMIDTVHHMGMSISMAQGLAEAFKPNDINGTTDSKAIAMIGDGTFFHSGIPSLLNAIYTKANMLLIIFDNRTIGMTGHQDHPGASFSDQYIQLDIPSLLKGMGVQFIETVDPLKIKDSFIKMDEAMSHDGVSVIISRSPCVLIPGIDIDVPKNSKIVVDPTRCNTCHNHDDDGIKCSITGSATYNLTKARAKLKPSHSIDATKQLCPANICNHGFFNAILDKDHKTAIEMVRDKMLFARTCGDICHRPCELFSGHTPESTVPIKQLKKYVSAMDDNFKDFSAAKGRVASAEKKGKHIGIVGAGPAGLSAAYDLIQCGYGVTIFEKEQKAGGLIKYAIPDFRMDKEGFDYEASQLEEMGVKFEFNKALGKEISLNKLSEQYDGVILAIGMGSSKTLDIIEDNIPENQRADGVSFLKDYNSKTSKIKSGSTVLVIGGGNSAIDSARSVKRMDKKNKVIVSCIETREDMPGFTEEVNHAIEEGIQFEYESYVAGCTAENGKGISIELHSYKTKQQLQTLQVDHVLTAIGQLGTKESFADIGDKNMADDNRIKADTKTGYTNYKNVYVAGDICGGNQLSVIAAIGSGKRAANGVRQLLEDNQNQYEGTEALDLLNSTIGGDGLLDNAISVEDLPTVIEKFDLFQTCEKCNHCIENFGCPALVKKNGKVTIDENLCTNCGLCIDVCLNDAIKWEKVQ